jgi:hypothetical protein
MTVLDDGMAAAVGSALDQEMRLVTEAIAMVASGASPRVVIAGIRFGEAILAPGRRMASNAGLKLVPIWRADESGFDVAIERA